MIAGKRLYNSCAGPGAAIGLILLLIHGPAAAGAGEDLYQLIGRVCQADGQVFRGVSPAMWLFSNSTFFSAHALADRTGRVKIKEVPRGLYTVRLAVPHGAVWLESVEIGPSFADAKHRVIRDFLLRTKVPGSAYYEVSAFELSVPRSARSEFERAQQQLVSRDIEGAIKLLKEAIRIAPQFAAAWNRLGTIAFRSKKYDEAERCFREALKQDPASYLPLVNLAGTLLSAGRIKEALPLNQEAAYHVPDDPLAQSQLGQNYFLLNQLDEAEQHLRLACRLDPSHFTYPQLVLADIYQRRRDFPSLAHELEEFLTLHPDSNRLSDVKRFLNYARSRSESGGQPCSQASTMSACSQSTPGP